MKKWRKTNEKLRKNNGKRGKSYENDEKPRKNNGKRGKSKENYDKQKKNTGKRGKGEEKWRQTNEKPRKSNGKQGPRPKKKKNKKKKYKKKSAPQKEPRISWSCCVISHLLCWSFWPIPISIIIWTEYEIMRYIVTRFYRPQRSYYTTGRSEQTGDARWPSRCSKKPEPEWWALRLVIIKLFPPKMDDSLKWGYPKMDSLQWNILLWWILWGYPYFGIPPKLVVSDPKRMISWGFHHQLWSFKRF